VRAGVPSGQRRPVRIDQGQEEDLVGRVLDAFDTQSHRVLRIDVEVNVGVGDDGLQFNNSFHPDLVSPGRGRHGFVTWRLFSVTSNR